MKTTKTLLMLLAITLFITSCSKEDDDNNPNLQGCGGGNYGWVKVHNTHDSNYDIWINGTYKGSVSGYGTSASFQYANGTSIHVYALQLDGYLIYPSEFDAYGTIVECQTITTNYYKPTVSQ